MAQPKRLKMKKSTKKVVNVEINEGTYVDTTVSNTNSGGPGTAGRAGWRAKNKTGSPDVQGEGPGPVSYQAPKNSGKMAISELPGQYTKPIPVPVKPKKPAPKKARPTAK